MIRKMTRYNGRRSIRYYDEGIISLSAMLNKNHTFRNELGQKESRVSTGRKKELKKNIFVSTFIDKYK